MEPKGKNSPKGISTIVVPCSARKAKLYEPSLNVRSLTLTSISDAARDWTRRLQSARGRAELPAKDLYTGRAFKAACALSQQLGCSFFVASAGLGLVSGHTRVPSYELSVLSIVPRLSTSGRKQIAQWWEAIEGGPFSSAPAQLSQGKGRILVAITQPYAALLSRRLASLPRGQRDRLRILGFGLDRYLPTSLRSQLVRYDDRLDTCLPGVGFDRAVRALVHFGVLAANEPIASFERDQQLVDKALAHVPRRCLSVRQRVSDVTLAQRIEGYLSQGMSMSIALKQLRAKDGVACEEKRFRRLYREATA